MGIRRHLIQETLPVCARLFEELEEDDEIRVSAIYSCHCSGVSCIETFVGRVLRHYIC